MSTQCGGHHDTNRLAFCRTGGGGAGCAAVGRVERMTTNGDWKRRMEELNEESGAWIRKMQAINAGHVWKYTTTSTTTDWASKWNRLEVVSPAISGWYWIASDKKSKPIICYVNALAPGWAEVWTDTHTYTPHDAGVLWWPERIGEPPPP